MRKALLVILSFSLFLGVVFSQEVVTRKNVVAIQDANVRSMPSTQGEILFVLHAGEKAELIEDMGTWLKIRRSDGAIGYVWSKLVRVEVEKVVKPAPKPVSPPAPKPKPKPVMQTAVPSPRTAQFGLSFNFNYALVSPDDFNATGKYFQAFMDYISSAPGSSKEGKLEGLKHLLGGEVEMGYYPTENIGIGLGFSFNNGHVSESTKVSDPGGNYFQISQDLKASVYGPYLGFHFSVPAQLISLEVFGNVGYYFGNFSMKYTFSSSSSGSYWYISMENMKKSSLGFGGGARLNIRFSPNAGIFLAGKYQFIKFSDIEGHFTTPHDSYDGTLYYFEVNTPVGWLPFTMISETEPPPAPDIRNVRKAVLNFSGFYLGAGFFLRF